MCDIYGHKCECCDTEIMIHIGDWKHPRDKYKVWCGRHMRKAVKGAVLFTATKPFAITEPDFMRCHPGWKCVIAGPEVGSRNVTHPNYMTDWQEEKMK